jgi:hypothetical protein
MHAEAKIIVNGVELSLGQSMTLRVALTTFISDMKRDGLGDDETGNAIANGYIDRGEEVLLLMLGRR